MRNTRYYPFERNRYFYGKLLTVRDFETEQKYFNDKRRLINRLLHGSGVVCGLQVVAVDEKTISVEAGVAVDYAGREIVVSAPVTQKLSMIEGFTNNEYSKDVYLYLAYDEKGKEPVHSVASSSTRPEEVSEHNRFLESYRLYIQEEAPDPSRIGFANLAEESITIYRDDKVRVRQVTPRFVNPGQTFELVVKVEKVMQTPRIELEYSVTSQYFDMFGSEGVISFAEPEHGQSSSYEVKYLMKAREDAGVNDYITVKDGRARLKIGDKEIDAQVPDSSAITITAGQATDRLMKQYLDLTLEQRIGTNPDQGICLARISLLKIGPTFMIERVEPVPFGEYVFNTSHLYTLGLLGNKGLDDRFKVRASAVVLAPEDEPQLLVNYDPKEREFDFRLGLPEPRVEIDNLASGVVDIELESNSKAGNSYFSPEIEHGLGNGPVMIITAVEEQASTESVKIEELEDRLFAGDHTVFQKSPYECQSSRVSVGTVAYPSRGTFRIGVKLQDDGVAVARVHWWAYRQPK